MVNKKILLSVVVIIVLAGLIVGGTYAYFAITASGAVNTIETGLITFSYTEPNSHVTLASAYPTSDENGIMGEYFQFTVSATASGEQDINYYVYFTLDDNNTFPADSVKLHLVVLEGEEELEISGYPKYANQFSTYETGYLLDSGIFETNANTLSRTYRLRMWIDQNYSDNSSSKTFSLMVNTYGNATPQ